MKKRSLILLGVLVGLTALPLTAADAKSNPHILYILADDMGYADPGFMGSKEIRTPNLDKLANEGTILSSYYVQPVCSPTRSTLMTGRYVSHTGVYTVVRPNAPWGLPLGERLLPQALKEVGYETAIVGKWHLGEFQADYRPMQRGFDHQYGLWFGNIDYFTHQRDGVLDWHRDDQPCKEEGYSTQLIAKEACRLIRERKADKPLFMYLPFNGVHAPYQVPDNYSAAYPNLTGVRKTYAGMVTAMDEAIGQVLGALEEMKMRENTLIIFSSDNGGPSPGRITNNGVLRGAKGTTYEGGIRVCAAVNWPGHIPAGKVVAEPLHGIDWYPTLLNLAGGSLEQKLPIDGKDIWNVLTQGAKSPHDALLLCGQSPKNCGVRMGDWKLLRKSAEETGEESGGGTGGDGAVRVELYNLADDLSEKHDLSKDNPEKAKLLLAELDRLMKDAVAPGEKGQPQKQGQKNPKQPAK